MTEMTDWRTTHRVVAVAGGRHYSNRDRLFEVLDGVNGNERISLIVEGGAAGADRLARLWAKLRGIPCATFHAAWKNGLKAGPQRTTLMLELCRPDMLVLFPGGVGTEYARKEAVRLDVRWIEDWTEADEVSAPAKSKA